MPAANVGAATDREVDVRRVLAANSVDDADDAVTNAVGPVDGEELSVGKVPLNVDDSGKVAEVAACAATIVDTEPLIIGSPTFSQDEP